MLLPAAAALGAPAAASTPTLLWRDATAVGVQCLVQSDARGYEAELAASLCERVRAIAARAAPAPVRVVQLGDPALVAPGAVALLVHGSVQPSAGGRLLAFTIRPFRPSAAGSEILFGAAPRVAPIAASGAATPALDAALAAALSETLPWQHRPQGPRPIAGRP